MNLQRITLPLFIVISLFVALSAPVDAAFSMDGHVSGAKGEFQEGESVCESVALPELAKNGVPPLIEAEEEGLRVIPAASPQLRALREAVFLLGEGDRLYEEGDFAGAREKWLAAADRYQEAGELLGESDAYLRLGNSYNPLEVGFNPELLDEVLTYYQKALFASAEVYETIIVKHLEFDQEVLSQANALYEQGLALYESGDCPQAGDLLSEARPLYQSIDFDAGELRVLMITARCQVNQNNVMGALLTVFDALAIAQGLPLGSSGHTRYNEGMALYEQGKWHKALQVLQEAREVYEEEGDISAVGQVTQDMATIYARLGNFPEAEAHYQEASELFVRANDEYSAYNQAGVQNNLGHLATQSGRYEDAMTHYTTAITGWQRLGLPEEEIASRSGLGVALRDLGKYEVALNVLQEAQAIQNRLPSEPEIEGDLLNNMALVYYAQGKYQKALDFFEQALVLRRGLPHKQKEIDTHSNIATVLASLGRFDDALQIYEEILSLVTISDSNSSRSEAGIRSNVATIYIQRGEYQQALSIYSAILPVFEENEELGRVAGIHNDIGEAYRSLGDLDNARSYFRQALELYSDIDQLEGSGLVRNNLGAVAFQENDLEEAKQCFEQSLEIWEALDNPAAISKAYGNLAWVAAEEEEWEQALTKAQTALSLSQEVGNRADEVRYLILISTSYLGLGDYAKAQTYGQQALNLATELGDPATEMASYLSIALADYANNDYSSAYENIQSAIERVETLHGAITISELKTSFLDEVAGAYALAVQVATHLGLHEDAFYYAEQARSRAFLDQLSRGQANFRAGSAASLLEKEGLLKEQMQARRAQLITLHKGPSNEWDRKTIDEVKSQLTTLEAEYEQLLIDIKVQSPEVGELLTVEVAKLSDIQRLLDPDTTLVEYFVLDEQALAFVITRESFDSIPLPVGGQALADRIKQIQTVDFAYPDKVHSENLQQLHNWLIAPLQAHLTTPAVGIVPHSALHYLPFAALTDGKRFLSDDYILFNLPSASMLHILSEKNNPNAEPTADSILVLGNPTIETPFLSSLSYAAQEAETVADLYNTNALTTKAATESVVWSHAPKKEILHLAAHGEYNPHNALFSTIYLAKDKDEKHDGRLEVHELYGLDLTQETDLVVLSACQTQEGEVSNGDEIVALNRAFLYAGTPTVIASLWSVDDAATGQLMAHFYTHLRAGKGKAEALRQAQLDLRANETYAHPYYWAAFTLVGEMGHISPAPAPTPWRWIGGGVLVLVLVIGVGVWGWKGRR